MAGLRERVADWLGVKAASGAPVVTGNYRVPLFNFAGDLSGEVRLQELLGQSPSQLWRSQPHLRTVVDFLARNVAQLGLHSYERTSDTDRRRVSDVSAAVLSRPNPAMTRYELIESLVSDLALYDNAYWHVTSDSAMDSGWRVTPLPASWVMGSKGGDAWAPDVWLVTPLGGDGRQQEIPADQVVHFHGWDPLDPGRGTSPVKTLKQILAEQVSAYAMREAQSRNGNRISAVLTRPAGAPEWAPEDKAAFRMDWKARFGSGGTEEGGTPILPDGMQLEQMAFSATDQQFVEAAKLALATVAAVYHVSPIMVGVLDNANYSNVREFRRMLYGDTLGPILARAEARVNAFLLPMIGASPDVYVEFNIAEKLQGSFEEQASVMSTATGAPWLTRNEARAMQNRPAVDGGDELVTPLNVLIGGQASPQDGGTGKSGDVVDLVARRVVALIGSKAAPALTSRKADDPVRVKAAASEEQSASVEGVLSRFFERQSRSVLSGMGRGAKADGEPGWWDAERWDKELTADLHKVALQVSTEIGQAAATELGFDAAAYDADRTEAFLEAVAKSRASMINATTLAQLQAAVASSDDDEGEPGDDAPLHDSPEGVFDLAKAARAAAAAVTLATTFAAFGTTEAAKQMGAEKATKTWIVTSGNPRSEHAVMDGETVGIDEKFSNGADWPGDPVLGADGVAGCQCSVEVEVP